MLPNIECALRYASLGLEVFPCHVLSKIPATANGFLDASSDPEIVKELFKKNPGANVAVRIPKGYIVLDIDNLKALDKLGSLPETMTARTPRHGFGFHLWYRVPKDINIKRIINKELKFDILNSDGYVIAPNSKHPSGYHYKWVVPPRSKEFVENLPYAPEFLINLARESSNTTPTSKYSSLNVDKVLYGLEEGERQKELFRFASSLRGRNVGLEEAIALVKLAAENATPPYTERPVEDIVRRVYKTYAPNVKKKRKIWKVNDLLETDFGDVEFIIEKILPQGFTLFHSDPKMGKSMLLANMAKSIAEGTKVLGALESKRSKVLYLDLEQGELLGKERWRRILKDKKTDDNLETVYEWDLMDLGGLRDLDEYIRANSDVRVIVIDVLAAIWPAKDYVSGTQYQKDYAVVSRLAKLANENHISIIGVHHNTKNTVPGGDFIKHASGSMGMTAASDTIWCMERTRNQDYALLRATGKNIKEQTLRLQSFNEGFSWYSF